MINKVLTVSLTFACLAIITATPANAANATEGKIIAKKVCQTCHGMDGLATSPVAANLSGQQEIYLLNQLKKYRSGKREDPQMSIIIKMLSDTDIENVAAYYSGIKISIEMTE